MSKKEVIDYVLDTPLNTNPTILSQKLDDFSEGKDVIFVSNKVPELSEGEDGDFWVVV